MFAGQLRNDRQKLRMSRSTIIVSGEEEKCEVVKIAGVLVKCGSRGRVAYSTTIDKERVQLSEAFSRLGVSGNSCSHQTIRQCI